MEKTELGFVVVLEIQNDGILNLCFKAVKGDIKKLDNNNGQNYIFPIEETFCESVITQEITNKIQSENKPEILDKNQDEELMKKLEIISNKIDKLSKDIESINSFIEEFKKVESANSSLTSLANVNENKIKESKKADNKNVNNDDNDTLLISEIQGKIFLPYKIADLQNTLKKNECYKDISDLIEKKYIIPTSQYKWPIISRYRETFKLMREKEKASIIESVKLALELSMNSLLNPAIIAACKNLDELDIYLDCLENNELDKFKIFKVQYEIAPATVK